jgi:Tfp pilus assembly PilM family ATPase
MSTLASFLAAAPADAVVEISPEAVSIAALAARGQESLVQGYAVEPLPPGAVVASLTAQNIVDQKAVVERLRAAVARLPLRPKRVALLMPDTAGRVSLVRFEQVPSRPDDLEQLVRWQVKKSAPFPVEDAAVTYMPAGPAAEGGTEFLVLVARRDVVRGYESVCEALDMHAGLVDFATLGVVNLCLASAPAGDGDWLLVHVRPEYTSVAIVRGGAVIFFRSLSGEDGDTLVDVVHQTTMYYQDRLGGTGFSRVLLTGVGRTAGTIDEVRRSLESRLGVAVQRIDASRTATFADRIGAAPDLLAWLAPLVGTWMRMRLEAATA